MTQSVNKVFLLGNVGKDPEIKRFNDGKCLANITLATSEVWKDKTTGEKKERTEWHRVVAFGDGLCKVVERMIRKGTKLYVEGQIQTRRFTDNNGVEKFSTEIVVQGHNGMLNILDGRDERPAVKGNTISLENEGIPF